MNKRKIKYIILFLIIVLVLLFLYSYKIEPKRLKVKEYRIINEKFTNNIHGYKIVHISDIHYGTSITKKELDKIINKINQTKPNILIFTGDFIDRSKSLTEEMIEEIEKSFEKLNKDIILYEIKGEDDVVTDNFDLLMENLGFNSLNNKIEELYLNQSDYILLAGIESLKGKKDYETFLTDIDNKLSKEENKPLLSILIMHEPDILKNINTSSYDLVLAGHTHNGQVRIPLLGGLKYPKNGKEYKKEHFSIENTEVFISNGLGTTLYKVRLGSTPSFNLYRIVSY